jgi:hypothetical protein
VITRQWRRMAEIYRLFSDDRWDFSEQAAEAMFLFESRGVPVTSETNGYLIGKRFMDVTVTLWKKNIELGLLTKFELYADPEFKDHHWWLSKVIGPIYANLRDVP